MVDDHRVHHFLEKAGKMHIEMHRYCGSICKTSTSFKTANPKHRGGAVNAEPHP